MCEAAFCSLAPNHTGQYLLRKHRYAPSSFIFPLPLHFSLKLVSSVPKRDRLIWALWANFIYLGQNVCFAYPCSVCVCVFMCLCVSIWCNMGIRKCTAVIFSINVEWAELSTYLCLTFFTTGQYTTFLSTLHLWLLARKLVMFTHGAHVQHTPNTSVNINCKLVRCIVVGFPV